MPHSTNSSTPARPQAHADTPRMVTQAELQTTIDLVNGAELLSADIRRRIESGAEFERGALGITTFGQPSLEWYETNGGIGRNTGNSGLAGVNILPVADLDRLAVPVEDGDDWIVRR